MASPALQPALASGCFVLVGLTSLYGVFVYGPKFGPAASGRSVTVAVNRFQIVAGRAKMHAYGSEEVPEMVRIDTVTGKSWAFMPLEAGTNPASNQFDVIPNRWVEMQEFSPSVSPSPSSLTVKP